MAHVKVRTVAEFLQVLGRALSSPFPAQWLSRAATALSGGVPRLPKGAVGQWRIPSRTKRRPYDQDTVSIKDVVFGKDGIYVTVEEEPRGGVQECSLWFVGSSGIRQIAQAGMIRGVGVVIHPRTGAEEVVFLSRQNHSGHSQPWWINWCARLPEVTEPTWKEVLDPMLALDEEPLYWFNHDHGRRAAIVALGNEDQSWLIKLTIGRDQPFHFRSKKCPGGTISLIGIPGGQLAWTHPKGDEVSEGQYEGYVTWCGDNSCETSFQPEHVILTNDGMIGGVLERGTGVVFLVNEAGSLQQSHPPAVFVRHNRVFAQQNTGGNITLFEVLPDGSTSPLFPIEGFQIIDLWVNTQTNTYWVLHLTRIGVTLSTCTLTKPDAQNPQEWTVNSRCVAYSNDIPSFLYNTEKHCAFVMHNKESGVGHLHVFSFTGTDEPHLCIPLPFRWNPGRTHITIVDDRVHAAITTGDCVTLFDLGPIPT